MSESKQAKKLLRMKGEIEEKVALKNRLEGQKEQIEKKLKEQFNCIGEKQINAKVKLISSKIEKKQDELNDELDELEENFEWSD